MGVTTLAFNNCAKVTPESLQNLSVDNPETMSEDCESALFLKFKSGYHGFLQEKCATCHSGYGPGIGSFASSDLNMAFDSFQYLGYQKLTSQALDEGHRPPNTGSANSTALTPLRADWEAALQDYNSCNEAKGVTVSKTSFKLIEMPSPRDLVAYTKTDFTTLKWDVETQSDRPEIVAYAQLDVRAIKQNGSFVGYEFKNAALQLKYTATKAFRLQRMKITLNGEPIDFITTYVSVDTTLRDRSVTQLAAGASSSILLRDSYSINDTFGMIIEDVQETSDVLPPLPTSFVTFAQLRSATDSKGVFGKSCVSCHGATAPKANLNLTNYNQARAAANKILVRIDNEASPMPQAGLLSVSERDIIKSWIFGGYNP
jgi:hypothetical protein